MSFSRLLWSALLLLTPVVAMAAEPPRLIVLVSVDQLCQEYFLRFGEHFAADGLFRTVDRSGARYTQCHHRHAFTVTAPGHAAMLTGTYPYVHGIVGNRWIERTTGKSTYCVQDSAVELVGLPPNTKSKEDDEDTLSMSPRNLLVETLGDRLKLATGGKGKVFGLAWKDRAGILMTGHAADGVYWFARGHWVTSTYYRNSLPQYLRALNEGGAVRQFAGKTWELLLPPAAYRDDGPDDFPGELPPKGMTRAMPHALPAASDPAYLSVLPLTPFANEYTLSVAREMIVQEQLGADDVPDLLAIGLSANDYLGHAFGPYSREVEDMTYRTDLQLAGLTRFLDQQVGAGKWTLALTADHGVAPIPKFAAMRRLPAMMQAPDVNLAPQQELEKFLRSELQVPQEAPPLVVRLEYNQVYLRREHPALKGESLNRAQLLARDWLLLRDGTVTALAPDQLLVGGSGRLVAALQRAWHPRRSGDVLYVARPYLLGGKGDGTTHGAPWRYDTHVPLFLLGRGIRPGTFDREVAPGALATTFAALLGIDGPSAAEEPPLSEALADAPAEFSAER